MLPTTMKYHGCLSILCLPNILPVDKYANNIFVQDFFIFIFDWFYYFLFYIFFN
ncbi:MAG: hypothetical protein LBP59_13500 [Planctomycetaceae bacterium]|nr:hypothetical protein [Planctomycetaceae bacterium]